MRPRIFAGSSDAPITATERGRNNGARSRRASIIGRRTSVGGYGRGEACLARGPGMPGPYNHPPRIERSSAGDEGPEGVGAGGGEAATEAERPVALGAVLVAPR